MTRYKILFCGLGSIGKRHIKNVVSYCKANSIEVVIDAVRSTDRALDNDISGLIRTSFSYEEEINEIYDIAFITNPTHKHFDTIKNYSRIAKNMFIEKPVFNSIYCNIAELGLRNNGVYYVACPLRYNKVLQYLKNDIDLSDTISIRAICSSYLPDWRPSIDYRTVYSAHKDMGGGVAIDLVHEWDYLTWLFGFPTKVYNLFDTISNLEIDSEDVALYIGQKGKLTYELHLDYYGRKAIREIQIFKNEDTIVADIIGGTIKYLKSGREISLSEERNDYQMREIERFFDIINGKVVNDNSIDNALKVMHLSLGVN